ncbi:MAG: sigma-54-dependent Fis family transcriptional regulator [Desulfofustis sp.]|nr:sigma-54-dependent Fis family transcriptional regulator [Desulfofustis sp.]
MNKPILIIDDEATIRESLSDIIEDEGFSTLTASTAEEGLELVETENVALVLLDIWLGDGMDGLTALKRIKDRLDIPVIMISGHGNIETAVQAIQDGAHDFIEKPLSYEKVILSVANGLRYARLENENRLLRERSVEKAKLTGESERIASLRRQIEMVAPTDAWVLITGEHGTGKELVAQAIHRLSTSADQPMIEVNCTAIPEELIESELFGHVKGSFTGAQSNKRGKFDLASGGILFLDEIGDMSLKTQAKILRILQEQKFERFGGSRTIKVNVRVLAATNKNLEEEIEKGNFRADLYYRLNVVPIHVPRLAERTEDIPELVAELMQRVKEKGLVPKKLSAEALSAMKNHNWPGNVRELRNFVERLAIMCPGETIEADTVKRFLGQAAGLAGRTSRTPFATNDFKEARRLFEREYLQQKLEENQGNITRTAETVGLERSHLHKKLKSLEIIN